MAGRWQSLRSIIQTSEWPFLTGLVIGYPARVWGYFELKLFVVGGKDLMTRSHAAPRRGEVDGNYEFMVSIGWERKFSYSV